MGNENSKARYLAAKAAKPRTVDEQRRDYILILIKKLERRAESGELDEKLADRIEALMHEFWPNEVPASPGVAPAQGPSTKLERWGRADEGTGLLLQRRDDGYWTPWHIAQAALDAASGVAPVEALSEGEMIRKQEEDVEAFAKPPGVAAAGGVTPCDEARPLWDANRPQDGYVSDAEWAARKARASGVAPTRAPEVIGADGRLTPHGLWREKAIWLLDALTDATRELHDGGELDVMLAHLDKHPSLTAGVKEAPANWRELLGEPPAGVAASEIVVTKNPAGQIVAVTRQDAEGCVLEVIAESAAGVSVVDGETLAP